MKNALQVCCLAARLEGLLSFSFWNFLCFDGAKVRLFPKTAILFLRYFLIFPHCINHLQYKKIGVFLSLRKTLSSVIIAKFFSFIVLIDYKVFHFQGNSYNSLMPDIQWVMFYRTYVIYFQCLSVIDHDIVWRSPPHHILPLQTAHHVFQDSILAWIAKPL